MTKKKRNHPGVEEILQRPWCYYCERDFDDLKILINHQKAKHFKCERCGRRLNTAGGLSVHMSQVHKENLTAVDNALPNRVGLDIEIFGMMGIPEDIVQQHNQRVLTQYHQAEAERRAATGNAGPGAPGANANKKPKTEDMSDLKKRLAEHKAAKLASEQNGGGSSGSATPVGAGQSQPTPTATQHPGFQFSAPGHQQYPQSYAAPPSAVSLSHSPAYTPTAVQPVHYQAPGYPNAASPVYGQPQYQPPPFGQPAPAAFTPQHPYAAQPFSPSPLQTHSPYPGQQFSPALPPNGHHPYSGSPANVPRPFGAGSPTIPHHHHQQQRTHSPAQNGLPQRTGSGSLPAAPGLPQRPAFGAPQVNAYQFQQMHQGQIPAPQTHIPQPQHNGAPGVQSNGASAPPLSSSSDAPNSASIDDLISSASKQADANAAAATATTAATESTPNVATPQPVETAHTQPSQEPVKDAVSDDKAAKKEKEKAKQTRLVYSDNEFSPEEKMARLPRYAFTPQQTIAA